VSEANDVEVLMFNTESIQNIHLEMGRQALKEAPTCEQVRDEVWTLEEARRFLLADSLKDWYEWMVDDIRVKRDGYMPREFIADWEYRQNLIATFAQRAVENLDFHELAQTILDRLKSVDQKDTRP
jgi:hypothetical protein